MAVTVITRTAIIDDDLTGTTGTILDDAWKQELYDQIDGLFDGALEIGGAMTIAGALSGVTSLTMSGALTGATTGAFSGAVTVGGRLSATSSASYVVGEQTPTGDAIQIISSGVTPGTGVFGGGLTFMLPGSSLRRRAGIALVQGDSDADQQGLAFFTHTSSGAANDMVEGMRLYNGLVVGSPTGGAKGSGTVNATAVYDDNTLLTDWVFDLHYAGVTEHMMPDGGRLYALDEVEAIARIERRLPWMPTRDAFEVDRSLGGMVTRLWFGQEQQQLYLFDLAARVAALEAAQ